MVESKDNIELAKKLNSTIVGRKAQIDFFYKLFDNVLDGDSSTVLIKGQAGVGKSYLVSHIMKTLLLSNASCISGKQSQYSKKTYGALSDVIDGMLKKILTLPANQYNIVVSKIKKALGNDIGYLYNMSATTHKVFKDSEAKNIDYSKSKYRIRKLFASFFLCIAEAFFPLVVFIDDLQWANDETINILNLLSKDQTQINFMLILSCRDNVGLKSTKEIVKTANVIELNPMHEADIETLLCRVFGHNLVNTTYLVRIIYGLTLGNPFYVRRILELFIHENIFTHDDTIDQWFVDVNKINQISLPNGVEDIVKSKIQLLNRDEKKLIQYIACLDGSITEKQIVMLFDKPNALIKITLDNLCTAAFIATSIQNEENYSYRIIHDIILEWVYKDLTVSTRKQIHYEIAKDTIASTTKPFSNIELSFLASQLIRSDIDLWEQKEEWVNLLYEAGNNAIINIDYNKGIEIFECCSEIWDSCSIDNADLEINILLRLAKCHYYKGNSDASKSIYEDIIGRFICQDHIFRIKKDYMQMLAFIGEDKQVITLGKELLASVNFNYDSSEYLSKLSQIPSIYTDEIINNLKNNDNVCDMRSNNILDILNIMMTSEQIIDDKSFMYALVEIAIVSVNGSDPKYASLGCLASSYVFYHMLNDKEKGENLARISMCLADDIKDDKIKTLVYSFLASFILHWTQPIEETIKLLKHSIGISFDIGQIIYCEYAINSMMFALCVSGAPIKKMTTQIQKYILELDSLSEISIRFIRLFLEEHTQYLTDGIDITNSNNAITKSAEMLVIQWFSIQRAYLSGDVKKAYKIVNHVKDELDRAKGHIVYIELLFYNILVRCEYHNQLDKSNQKENKEYIKQYLAYIKQTVDHYPNNHEIRYIYASGIFDSIFGDGVATSGLYNKGILLAQDKPNFYLEAIGNLLASKFYKNNKLGRYYNKEASLCFKKWGAVHIANILCHEYEESRVDDSSLNHDIEFNNISTIIRKIEIMDEAESFLYTLDNISDICRCNYCAILFEENDDMYLAYQKVKSEKAEKLTAPILINYCDNLSKRVVRYAARSGKTLMLNGMPQSGIFAYDKYIIGKPDISITCIPFYYFDIFIGIIYLENSKESILKESIETFVKGIIPTLLSKCKNIKEINFSNILGAEKSNTDLTNRELEVLELVALGLSNIDISKKLFISSGTVKSHLKSIYSKLEVDNRIKAVVKAKELNII